MTEADWLTSEDPSPMLAFLDRTAKVRNKGRKLRLFACACCRHIIWPLLADSSRQAVRVAERYADGMVSHVELEAARQLASNPIGEEPYGTKRYHAAAAAQACARTDWSPGVLAKHAAAGAYESGERVLVGMARRARAVRDRLKASRAAVQWAKAKQAALLRDIFPNPFCPRPRVARRWLAWGDGTVVRLSRSIYDESCFEDMPILADALEEAGCDSQQILAHCRNEGAVHVRGCWVLDLLLAKQ